MHIYKITADYRPKNPNKPYYYILAKSTKEAKKIFERNYPWLKVYEVEPMPVNLAREIYEDPKQRPVNWIVCNVEDIC